MIADNRGIFIVPVVITHCPIAPSHTHLHPPPHQTILVKVCVVIAVLILIESLSIVSNYQSHTSFLTRSWEGGGEGVKLRNDKRIEEGRENERERGGRKCDVSIHTITYDSSIFAMVTVM